MILNFLGSPSKDDKSFITDPQALAYIEKLPDSAKVNFQMRYPAVGEDGVFVRSNSTLWKLTSSDSADASSADR